MIGKLVNILMHNTVLIGMVKEYNADGVVLENAIYFGVAVGYVDRVLVNKFQALSIINDKDIIDLYIKLIKHRKGVEQWIRNMV